MNLHGQRIAIAGAGRSGLAAARLALHHGADVFVLDSGDPSKLTSVSKNLPQATFILGSEALSWHQEIDLLVVSPGIDLQSPLLAPWTQRSIPIIGEIELASRFWKKPVIGITGTNGKTTTTELTAHLLQANGLSALPGGNYGKPFAEIVLDEPTCEIAVLELSSFQLETIDAFRPDISVWMNFAADHLDRYPDVDAYREAKRQLFRNQTPGDHAVVNAANGPDIPLTAQTLTFSAFQDDADFHFHDGTIFHRDQEIAVLSETHLTGRHNAENLMAALACGILLDIDPEGLRRAASDYRPPRHRCERLVCPPGLTILNDSKATNLHALESSLRALDGPIVLVAGGKNKGLDYSSLIPWLGEKVVHLVTLGEIRHPLAALAGQRCPATPADSLEEAVEAALQAANAARPATLLFSPGTSSFDMFNGYEHRGDAFCAAIKQQLAQP